MAREVTAAELRRRIVDENRHEHGTVLGIMNKWLAGGAGVAVYVNRDAHATLSGQSMYVSYGAPGAILAGEPEAPERLFDSRYVLDEYYRGEPMEES
jgi:hypothetical protein